MLPVQGAQVRFLVGKLRSHKLCSTGKKKKDLYKPALFTTAKTWKQPKCPSTDEWIKKMWYTHTMEHYSTIKKNEIIPFVATWMQLEIIILSEVRKTNTI